MSLPNRFSISSAVKPIFQTINASHCSRLAGLLNSSADTNSSLSRRFALNMPVTVSFAEATCSLTCCIVPAFKPLLSVLSASIRSNNFLVLFKSVVVNAVNTLQPSPRPSAYCSKASRIVASSELFISK